MKELYVEWDEVTKKLRETKFDLSKIKLTKKYDADEFIDLEGYEGLYQINSLGQIKSLPKMKGKYMTKESILKPTVRENGHSIVQLIDAEGKRRNCMVSRLVAKTFVANPFDFKKIKHKDGDKTNNRADNLEWYTNQNDYFIKFFGGEKC